MLLYTLCMTKLSVRFVRESVENSSNVSNKRWLTLKNVKHLYGFSFFLNFTLKLQIGHTQLTHGKLIAK